MEALVKRQSRSWPTRSSPRDKRIDALEAEVDRLAVRIIALRAPMADDLREVIAALKIAGVIERIGDYAKNIAKRVGRSSDRSAVRAADRCSRPWREIAREMVHDVLDCLCRARCRAGRARSSSATSKVDDFYNSIFRNLVTYMMENPETIISSARTCCSSPRTSSGSATMRPTWPRWSITPRPATSLTERRQRDAIETATEE